MEKCKSCDGSGKAFANEPPTGYICEDCNGTGKIQSSKNKFKFWVYAGTLKPIKEDQKF